MTHSARAAGVLSRRILTTTLLLLLVGALPAWSTLFSDYTFTESTGSGYDMTGSTAIPTTSDDDGSQTAAPYSIGFNFVFNGTTYTQFSVNSNGLMKLGGTPVVSGTRFNEDFPSFGPSASDMPFLAPFWDDLYSHGDKIRQKLVGTAPNRVLVVEWHTEKYSFNNLEDIRIQVRLYEGSNNIEFWYGGLTTQPGANTFNGLIAIAQSTSDYIRVIPGTPATATNTGSGTVTPPAAANVLYTFAAPISPCIFSAGTGSGYDMTGSTSIPTTSDDDGSQTAAPYNIGFNFNLNGTNYTQFSVNSNGLMKLGGTPVVSGTRFNEDFPTFGPTASDMPFITAFWDDLYSHGDKIRQKLIGTAPTRVLVVEWHTEKYSFNNLEDIRMQIRLYEGSNTIEFWYGGLTTQPGANTFNGFIGVAVNTSNYIGINPSTARPYFTGAQVVTPPAAANVLYTINYFAQNSPIILREPTDTVVCGGGPASLGIAVGGAGPFTYQWYRNGTPIAGGDTVYSIPAVTASDTGSYYVIVTSPCKVDTSATARVTLNDSTVITQQPTGTVACGIEWDLSVSATGTGPFTWQWYRNGVPVVGGNDSTYTIPSIGAADTGSYYAVVTGACNSDTSDTVTVSLPPAPAITLHPASQALCSGGFVDFVVGTTGGGLTYQWRRNGVAIAGADDSVLHIYPLYAELAGAYDVVVTDSCGRSITSNPAQLTLSEPPLFNETPNSQSTQVGQRVVLSVRVTGQTPIRYQWYKNGLAIPGATSDTYIIPSVTENDLGEYAVMATNACASSMSPSAFLYVQPMPRIITQPADVTGCEGDTLTLRVGATGFGLRYQWRRAGQPIAGATSSSLRFAPATMADSATYDVVITGQSGAPLTSDPVDLTVNRLAQITQQPDASVTGCVGSMLTLSVGTSGAVSSFQWRRNGVPIPNATGAVYTINPVSQADSGSYDVVIIGMCDDTTTSGGSVVAVEMPAQIVLQPVGDSLKVEDSITLQVGATGSNLRYQWRRNGVAIPGATDSTYHIDGFRSIDIGLYDVVVTGGCGTPDTSDVAELALDTSTSSVRFSSLGTTTRVEIAPNPTTSTARITITGSRPIGSIGTVRLAVVDGLGREVADLSDAYRAGGYTGATFDASELPPGVYLCRLTLGSESRIVGSIVVVR